MPKPTGSRSMIKFLIIWIGQFLSSVGSGMPLLPWGSARLKKTARSPASRSSRRFRFCRPFCSVPSADCWRTAGRWPSPSADGSAPDRAAASASLFVLAGLLVVLLTVFAFNLRSIRELSRRDPAAETV